MNQIDTLLFPIIIRCLTFVSLDIIFLDENKIQLFPEYSLVGGYYNGIDWATYREKCSFNYLGENYDAYYVDGILSINPYLEMKL